MDTNKDLTLFWMVLANSEHCHIPNNYKDVNTISSAHILKMFFQAH